MADVVGILGSSFCGSTFLNSALNTHPDIIGVGELHWVTTLSEHHRSKRPWLKGCSSCHRNGAELQDCPIFDPEDFPLPLSGLHSEIARRAGVGWVCDSSKRPVHFREYISKRSGDSYRFIVLIKKPEDAYLSFMKRGKRDPRKILGAWSGVYKNVIEFCRDHQCIVIKSEDLIHDLSANLSRVANFLGVAPTFSDDRLSGLHQIAGNSAYLRQSPRDTPDISAPDEIALKKAEGVYHEVLSIG